MWFQGNIPTPPVRGYGMFRRGRGVFEAKLFNGTYEANLEFPEGWGLNRKKKKTSPIIFENSYTLPVKKSHAFDSERKLGIATEYFGWRLDDGL